MEAKLDLSKTYAVALEGGGAKGAYQVGVWQAMEEAGQSSIGVNADIGHFFLEEEEPLKAIEKLGPYIVHAHLENMAAGVHNHLVPYEGDMDLKAYADKLHETGFHGCASLANRKISS